MWASSEHGLVITCQHVAVFSLLLWIAKGLVLSSVQPSWAASLSPAQFLSPNLEYGHGTFLIQLTVGAAPVPHPWNYLFQIVACLWAPLGSLEGWISHKWICSCKYVALKMMEIDQMKSLKTKGPESCAVIVEEYKNASSVSKTLILCLHFNTGLSFTHLLKWNLQQVQSKEHESLCQRFQSGDGRCW